MKAVLFAAVLMLTAPAFAMSQSEVDEAYADCMSEPGEVSDEAGILAACRAVAEELAAKECPN